MEVLQTTAKMQNSQMTQSAKAGGVSGGQTQLQSEAVQKAAQDAQTLRAETERNNTQKPETKEDMERLVKQLNSAIDPFRTSLRFGFDNTSDVFYVSVIETQSDKTIRRFPAEQAANLLPKVQELNGILFDEKG